MSQKSVVKRVTKKFKTKEIENCFFEDETSAIKKIEEEDWVSDHKFESGGMVFFDKDTGDFYIVRLSRTGDYWQGYEYGFEYEGDEMEATKVKTKIVKVEKWVAVEADEDN